MQNTHSVMRIQWQLLKVASSHGVDQKKYLPIKPLQEIIWLPLYSCPLFLLKLCIAKHSKIFGEFAIIRVGRANYWLHVPNDIKLPGPAIEQIWPSSLGIDHFPKGEM